jgi:curved DNA-binding protein
MESKNYYQTLGLSKGASADEIRKAYRTLAKKYHPDVNPGDKKAEDKFKEVTAAHDVLSDAHKRALYDEFGEVGLREGFDAAQARAYQQHASGWGGGGHPFGNTGDAEFDLSDLLGGMFGGGQGRHGGRQSLDMHATVEISFVDSLRGKEVQFQIPGAKGQPPEVVSVRIPPGADNGSKLRVQGKGRSSQGRRGDLVIETAVLPHACFVREGLDLVMKLPVTVYEAYQGAVVDVPTPDGVVQLKIPALSQQGTRLRLKGKGVTKGKQRGDMYAQIDIHMPDKTDPAVLDSLRVLERAYSQPVRKHLTL